MKHTWKFHPTKKDLIEISRLDDDDDIYMNNWLCHTQVFCNPAFPGDGEEYAKVICKALNEYDKKRKLK